jgi:glycogen debranching enzyme
MPDPIVSVFDGSTFAVSDTLGDMVRSDQSHGFFVADTRHLSVWRLYFEGRPLDSLSLADVDYFLAQFFLVPPRRALFASPELSIIRRRIVHGSWLEEISVVNHRNDPLQAELRLEIDADFADLFEVKAGRIRERPVVRRAEGDELSLRYRSADFLRETRISTDADATVSEDGFEVTLELNPREEVTLCFQVSPVGAPVRSGPIGSPPPDGRPAFDRTRAALHEELDRWMGSAPRLDTDWSVLASVYRRSLADLAALRFYPRIRTGEILPAAGLPWFMTAFGRDSIITSYQALPYVPELARGTLRSLAARQATAEDPFRDAEPGKILHEIRFGELTVNGELPYSPYFGSADSTPLFLILLDEFERWTGDRELLRELEPNARAALEWIDRYGDRDKDGYVEYERRNRETGLRNQCWKDSWNSIVFADGRLAETPIATCEIQGYVFDAKQRCARLAEEVWGDAELARRLRTEAEEMRTRFERDFWLEDRGHYALALDRDKRPVDSLTSNIGHLLWSGIASVDHAAATAAALLSAPLFSGWGVRTMSAEETSYSPLAYHDGTVWPHDNSLIAAGLARYGFRNEAGRICLALLEAATGFDDGLPEVFAGYDIARTRYPVKFPTACQPQAWAAAAPLLFVTTMLGMRPEGEQLKADACLPPPITVLHLDGVRGRWGRTAAGAPSDARQPAARAGSPGPFPN